jgi:hypothetical protein
MPATIFLFDTKSKFDVLVIGNTDVGNVVHNLHYIYATERQ